MTCEEEALAIVENDLLKAMASLKEKGIEQNDKNLLAEFAKCIQSTLATHLKNIREILDGTESREAELNKWLLETKKMMEALTEYKEKIDHDAFNRFSFFCDTVEKEVESKFKAVLTPSIN